MSVFPNVFFGPEDAFGRYRGTLALHESSFTLRLSAAFFSAFRPKPSCLNASVRSLCYSRFPAGHPWGALSIPSESGSWRRNVRHVMSQKAPGVFDRLARRQLVGSVLSGCGGPGYSGGRASVRGMCVSSDRVGEKKVCAGGPNLDWCCSCPAEGVAQTRRFLCRSSIASGDRAVTPHGEGHSVEGKGTKLEGTLCKPSYQVSAPTAGQDKTRARGRGTNGQRGKEEVTYPEGNDGRGEAARKQAEELADRARTAESMWQTWVPERNWGLNSPVFWLLLVVVIALHEINERRDRDRANSVTAADETEAYLREEVEIKRQARRTEEKRATKTVTVEN